MDISSDIKGLQAGLYLVPTPIGNLRDITLRALDILTHCDAVICEDSRITGKLLKAYNVTNKKKIIYNDHSNQKIRDTIINRINNGDRLALVSDAGTPLVCDPGYKLVHDCLKNDIYVTALPGANAVLPALQLSGLPSDHFTFGGFIPAKKSAAESFIETFKAHTGTLVFYDTAKRLPKTLPILQSILGNRNMSVVREISKLYEEANTDNIETLQQHIKDTPLKGEIVLVIQGADNKNIVFDIDAEIISALQSGQSAKDISTQIAEQSGITKKIIYQRVLDIKNGHNK